MTKTLTETRDWLQTLGYEYTAEELTNLTTLYLLGTSVTDDGLKHLTSLPNLTTLHLSWTSVTDDGLKHLPALTKLTVLYLSETAVTDEGLSALRSKRPNLRIYRSGKTQ